MRKSLAIGLVIFSVSSFIAVSAMGGMYQGFENDLNFFDKSNANNKHPLRDFIVKKAAFDAACNTIVLTLAILPECEECPDAKAADLKLKKAVRDIEKFNDYLSYNTPFPQVLDLKEKSAMGIIYRSIRDDAYSISITLDRWRLYLEDLLNNPWAIGAIIVGAIAVPLEVAEDNINEICFSVENEEECNLIGCYWYSNQQNSGGHCGDWP